VESEGAGRAPREHPVQHQRVDVDVEIHRPTEALDDGDTAAAWIGETLGACPGTQVPLDRPVQQPGDPPAQVVVPGQQVPDPVRHTQGPLADRHVGEDVVDEVRSTFGHAPTATARTDTSPLARERDQSLGSAVATPEPREATGQEPTPQEGPELVLDEPRQPVAVPKPRRLGANRLEVVPHDRVQDRRARVSRRVLGQAHGVGARVSHANTTGETQVDAASPLDVRDRFAGDCFCIRATATAVQESRTSADCVGLEVTLDHGRHRFPRIVVVPARRP